MAGGSGKTFLSLFFFLKSSASLISCGKKYVKMSRLDRLSQYQDSKNVSYLRLMFALMFLHVVVLFILVIALILP